MRAAKRDCLHTHPLCALSEAVRHAVEADRVLSRPVCPEVKAAAREALRSHLKHATKYARQALGKVEAGRYNPLSD